MIPWKLKEYKNIVVAVVYNKNQILFAQMLLKNWKCPKTSTWRVLRNHLTLITVSKASNNTAIEGIRLFKYQILKTNLMVKLFQGRVILEIVIQNFNKRM